MKRSSKILLLIVMIALSLSVFSLFAFAEDGAENNGSSGIGVSIDFQRFVNSLQYMWKGMLCIFIVIGVIILVVYALNKVVNYAVDSIENKKKANDDKSVND